MAEHAEYGLFEAYGIEIEFMIVDAETLDVAPVCDWLMTEAAGELTDEFDNGALAWNNELALHVLEFKTNGPVSSLGGLGEAFGKDIRQANELLAGRGLCLLPGAMHPWLDPARDIRLWPHGQREIYRAFDRIFDCRGHGWGNLQSMQINLPFDGDAEFAKLHAAIRLVLGLIPALAASSPIVDGRSTGLADNRMLVYRDNCRRVPSVTADVIPEPVYSIAEYERELLGGIYRDLEPLDPDGTLRHEWVNARGAIARFDRMAIEIRVIDSQEHPAADIALADLISGTVRALVEETWASVSEVAAWPQGDLVRLLELSVEKGERLEIGDRRFLRLFGIGRGGVSAAHFWGAMAEALSERGWLEDSSAPHIERYLTHGTLARRLLDRLGPEPGRDELRELYRGLADSLAEGRGFPD